MLDSSSSEQVEQHLDRVLALLAAIWASVLPWSGLSELCLKLISKTFSGEPALW